MIGIESHENAGRDTMTLRGDEMEVKKKTAKPALSMKEWIRRAYVENLITLLINSVIMSGIYFYVIGYQFLSRASITQIFFLVLVPFMTIMVPVTIIRSAREAYGRGKWEVKEGESLDKAGKPLSPWRRTLPLTLPLGAITAFVIYIILATSHAGAFSSVTAWAVGFGVTLVLTTTLLPLYLARDIASFAAAAKNPGQEKPKSFLRYFLWEYAGPTILILTIIGITFGYKSYYSELVWHGFVPARDALNNFALIAFIAAVWMWLEFQRQAREDLAIGRISAREKKALSPWVMLLITLLIGLAAGIFVGTPLYFAGTEHVTVFQSTVIHVVVWVVCGVIGCYLGLWWGRARGEYTAD
jgi:hypothetical protein